jgi:protease IV
MRLGALVAVSLSSAMLLACDGRARVGGAQATAREARRGGQPVAIFDLSEDVPEQRAAGVLGLPSKSTTLEDLVEQTEKLERDGDARGVLVRLGAIRVGLARATEIGAMLEQLGRKMPVWCHADELSNATIYLAARGCKRVWASPGASVDAIGLAAELVYFHKLLADTLGLDVDFLQVGKYKGAQEPFTRDGPSPEARVSLESTLSDVRAAWLDGIHRARPLVEDPAAEDGPYSVQGAKERGLVDDVGYFDQTRDALEREVGASRAEVRLGPGAESGAGDDIGDVMRVIAGGSMSATPVAVVVAVGAISMDGGGLLGEGGGISARRLLGTLSRLEKDDDVKAVVLRIDSPGGSALASDLLWHALMRVRAKKPLVVSIGDMAASGGYYMASAGSVIFADQTSIVGSIGVVGGKVAVDRALAKLGVHADTVAAKGGDPRAAARAAYESLLVPWDEPTRKRLLETMTGIYDLFVARVSEGRSIGPERVAASAEGRIFSGRDGKGRGLVDEIGGLHEAIVRARSMAGLPADARFGAAGGGGGILQTLLDDEPQGKAQSGPLVGPASPLASLIAPELVVFLASVVPLAEHEVALCALPYALTVH